MAANVLRWACLKVLEPALENWVEAFRDLAQALA